MVVRRVALHPNTIPTNAIWIKMRGIIDAHVDLISDGLDQALRLRLCLIDVVDKPIWSMLV